MTEREDNDINQARNSKTRRNVLWARGETDIGIFIRTSSSLNSKKTSENFRRARLPLESDFLSIKRFVYS